MANVTSFPSTFFTVKFYAVISSSVWCRFFVEEQVPQTFGLISVHNLPLRNHPFWTVTGIPPAIHARFGIINEHIVCYSDTIFALLHSPLLK